MYLRKGLWKKFPVSIDFPRISDYNKNCKKK